MKSDRRVASPPSKPLMVYDGDCHFCGLWIKRWHQTTGERVEFLKLQDERVSELLPQIPREDFEKSVHLIETNGDVYTGAEAALRALAKNPNSQSLLKLYESTPFFARVSETAYRFVANHRTTFSVLTRLAWGNHVERPDYFLTRDIFLRGLGLIYLIAFLSLGSQIIGLVGRDGILPASQYISAAEKFFDANNISADRYRMLPTLCWWNASDAALRAQCIVGAALAVLVIVGIAPAPCLFLLWLIYLSLSTVCRDFLSFQWDVLLLQTGFLAIFFAPIRLWPFRKTQAAPPSRAILWLLRWLIFQLMFESGLVKLTSGDTTWRNLTALMYHYESQPLPTWIGWQAHHLPLWFQKISCGLMFGIELVVPFLFFAPRRLRIHGAIYTVALQIFILLTGNFAFFNWLTILLCVPLLDDFAISKWIPKRLRFQSSCAASTSSEPVGETHRARGWPRWIIAPLTSFVLCVTVVEFLIAIGARWRALQPIAAIHDYIAPFRTFNSYGLFRVMTTSRPEIIVEGSDDGVNWRAYEFKWKPGDLNRRPGFVAPHQPRLDWQMWFAALSDLRHNPWFANFCVRLLEGSPDVLALLKTNPFPEKPPRYVHAVRYDYHFTTFAEHRATGAWWKREQLDVFLPAISLEDIQQQPR